MRNSFVKGVLIASKDVNLVKLESKFFESMPAEPGSIGPRFKTQTAIQTSIKAICEKWTDYLKRYVEQTENLFAKAELPWMDTERAAVSTLSASISQSFKDSLVLEECRVPKPATSSGKGRCDLWAFIPELRVSKTRLAFYLEAKKTSARNDDVLVNVLKGKLGISKLFRDYSKVKPGGQRLTHRVPYSKLRGRECDYYSIGLLIVELGLEIRRTDKVHDALQETFEGKLPFKMKPIVAKGTPKTKSRRLNRFPTVALIVIPDDPNRNGMVAIFMVTGSTHKL